jgi:intracellular multiplication protein IcmV
MLYSKYAHFGKNGMAVKDALKVSRKTFFNPRAWLGYDSLKDQTRTIWTFVRAATTTATPPENPETFEEAMERLNLTEDSLQTVASRYLAYAAFFVALTGVNLIYAIYLLFHHKAFLGLILGLAVCALLLAQAFRYHFWYFQIANRKLGCTLEEWRTGKVKGP